MASRLRQNRCHTGVAATAEGQAVIIHTNHPYDLCFRTAESHLVQVHIGTIGKIQFLAQHFTPYLSSLCLPVRLG